MINIVIKTAWRSLRANPGRSTLTVLGIVIGIVAIVLVISLGQGAQSLILNEINSIGGNVIIIRPGRQPENPADLADTILADSITSQDIRFLQRPGTIPGILSIDPAVAISGEATYQDNFYRPVSFGWTPNVIEETFNIIPSAGTGLTAEHIKQRAKVAVIGAKVKEELFGGSDAVGQSFKLRGHNIRVIGVYPRSGQVSFFNMDEVVLLPYTTAQKDILGINHFHEIFVRAQLDADVEQVAQELRLTLRELHDIEDPAKDDFFVRTQQDLVASVSTVTNVLTIFLVSIAAISLVVGGVGIMNIMLVSVTERTREIGLRKAVGATNADILKQFLAEAVILTIGGGIIGTSLAVVLSLVVSLVARNKYNLPWPIELPIGAIVLGVGVATLIGLIFGIYPARQAAKKNPIEALRYE